MFILNKFWAPKNMYECCGMFTRGHMILLLISIILLSILLFIFRNITIERVNIATKIMAIIITVLEGVKIYFNFYWGYKGINSWLPISYCSIFIYALWLSGYGKGNWKKSGQSFIAGCSVVAGGAYLLFPSTSLTVYPIWHYLCIYSMFFHTMMIYFGIIYIKKDIVKLDINNFNNYLRVFLIFGIIALTLNAIFNTNFMLLNNPFKIPISIIHKLYNSLPLGYTSLVFVIYLYIPYFITSFFVKAITKNKSSQKLKS
ncbi:YwaF family protein [Clostridium sp. D53t1_180928_C8]|uniref:TMEM164 family acyltransferase n=1 Tax=Clostridium sp. D53t1_180928_C8 TaxID=2787101 RepID=UPI0018AA2BCB|nr:YwaF family protein [Clostridium sp. D53t1_180928_C8]